MSSGERILTTHVGSLIRPPDLVAFLLKQQNGEPYDKAAFEACLKQAVRAVVRRQAEVGIDIVSDGEFGKTMSWTRYLFERLSGVEERFDAGRDVAATVGKDYKDFADFYREYDAALGGRAGLGKLAKKAGVWTVTGPLKYSGQAAVGRDIADFKEALADTQGVTGFMPVVAPASAATGRRNLHYKSDEEMLFGFADALRDEYKAITDAGFTVQIDDATLTTQYDAMVPPQTLADYRAWAELRIEALNRAIKGLPADKIRYHVCWGSWNGPHSNDVALKDIIDLLLKLNVGAYSLEMANPRHEHEWRVFETVKLPPGKKLLPGVISHATNVVEHPELVAERLVRLAKLVGRENVIGSTDCGFAQGPFTQRVHLSIQWAKLKALADGAALATEELWGRRAAA
jgi:5-methyltetrahydropteroyltriglutamate--homocysteine methyltransferase